VNEINKIVLAVVLFIVGTALSLMTSNFIISSGACFILGLLLNRPKRAQQKASAQTRTVPGVASVQARQPIRDGSNLTKAQRYSRERIVNTIKLLRDNDGIGYVSAVQNLRMVDDYGNYWSVGVRTLSWYVSQGGEWIRSLPSTPMRVSGGSSIVFDGRPVPTPAKALAKTLAKNICGFCGVENEPSSTFCINCGHQVLAPVQGPAPPPARTRACKRCGATVNARKRFCTKCGSPLPAA
jgi:hypothetical protein